MELQRTRDVGEQKRLCEAAREDLKLAEQRCERLEASNGRRDEAQRRALEGLEASLKASRDAERARDAAEAEQAKETAVAQAVAERDERAQAEAQSLRGEVARLRDEVLAAEEARGVSMDEKTAEARIQIESPLGGMNERLVLPDRRSSRIPQCVVEQILELAHHVHDHIYPFFRRGRLALEARLHLLLVLVVARHGELGRCAALRTGSPRLSIWRHPGGPGRCSDGRARTSALDG